MICQPNVITRTFQCLALFILPIFILVSSITAPVRAGQNDPRLSVLFDRLQSTKDETEAAEVTRWIWAIWIESENETINTLMAKGIEEMSRQNFVEAVTTFTNVVEADPNFAEGWNKRATVYYLMGEYSASILDVEQTLALEPRHFGALSGLGLIYLALGDGWKALKAFEGALKVNPHLTSAQIHVEELRKYLHGKPI